MQSSNKDSFVQVEPVEIKQKTDSFGAVSFGAQNEFLDDSIRDAAVSGEKLN